MKLRIRYILALVVNVALPALAYRLTFPHWGLQGALLASAAPVVMWMIVDYARYRHADALSALVLVGIAMSLVLLAIGRSRWLQIEREPLVSGVVGVLFLASLMLRRPLVFYLARSTMSRESADATHDFDAMWRERPALVRSVRIMTAVWGVGLVVENALRMWIAWSWQGASGHRASDVVSYAMYAAMTAWTVWYRRYVIKRQDTLSKPQDVASNAAPLR